MASDHFQSETTERGGPTRRTYLGALSGLLATGGLRGASADPVTASERGGPWQGISLSDSGATITEDLSHLDVGRSLTATALEDEHDVRIDLDVDASNPNVVHVQSDLGIEPGEDDLWGAIYEHYQSFRPTRRNHLYVVPPGTWLVETNDIRLEAHEFFGIAGTPQSTLRVNDQDVDRMMTVGTIDTSLPHAQRTVMQDLEIDIRGDFDCGIGRWYTYTFGLIQRVRMRGARNRLHPVYGGDRHTIMIDGVIPGTTNVIRHCHLNNWDISHDSPQVGHAIAFGSETNNRGLNIWEGCQVTGYTDNGFYVSSNSGRNILIGCTASNCAGAAFRIGANDVIRNCNLYMRQQPAHPWTGLWIENGSGQHVQNFYVRNEVRKPTEIIRCTQDGQAVLNNVRIDDRGTDGRIMRINDSDSNLTIFESCKINDRSAPSISDYGVYVQSSNVRFRDCMFDIASQSDSDRNGIFVNGRGNDVDSLYLDGCEVSADVASLRFADSGEKHNVLHTTFHDMVMSDSDADLEKVLWIGNHHEGRTRFNGQRSNWQGCCNWGFDV